MAKPTYAGSITHAGAQRVVAPIKVATKGANKVTTGKDLRAGVNKQDK